MSTTRWYTILAVCLLVMHAVVHASELDDQVTIDIPANTSLNAAVLQLGRSAGVQLMSEVANNKYTTRAVRGTLSLREALSKLLRNSGFTYQMVGNTVFVFMDRPGAGGQAGRPMDGAALVKRRNDEREVGEVVTVTGTHIIGARPSSSIVLDRAWIESSGFVTTGELIRSLPQNFGGGPSGYVIGAGARDDTLSQFGVSTPNLRALGNGSTLTLVDGHRLAPTATSGAADVDLVPLAAIDRIDIYTDGASAIYGSDAVAGVINIILRKEFRGVAASAAVGGTTEGGGYLRQYDITGGSMWDRGNMVASTSFSRQSDVDSAERRFAFSPAIQGTSLLPETRSASGFVSVEHSWASDIRTSIEGLWTRRSNAQTENLGSLAPGITTAATTRVNEYAVIAEAEKAFSGDWRTRVAANIASNAIVSPQSFTTGGVVYASESDAFNNRLWSAEATADGVLAQIPTGPVKVALGVGYRQETFRFSVVPVYQFPISHTRGVRFAYAEGLFPLTSESGKGWDRNRLILRLAGRVDQYDEFGSNANPKVELLYRPRDGIQLAASWSTSFRAPTMLEQYDSSEAILMSVPDRTAPGSTVTVLERFGGNPSLKPEISRATTFRVMLAPSPELLVQLAWYYIDDRGRIEFPYPNAANPLAQPNEQPFIETHPSMAQLESALEGAQVFYSTTPDDLADVVALVDNRYHNISQQQASGLDVRAGYDRATSIGQLDLSFNAAYLELSERATRSSPPLSLSGTVFYPPRYRARSGVSWKRNAWTAAAFLNYIGPSIAFSSASLQRVSPWSTVDSQLEFADRWDGIRVALSARNLLDRRPPYVDATVTGLSGLSFDPTNASALGRFVSLRVTKTW